MPEPINSKMNNSPPDNPKPFGHHTVSLRAQFAPDGVALSITNSNALAGFNIEQVNALSLVLLRVNDETAAVAVALFGPSTLLTGWLIMKSTFLPKWIGILSVIGGILWTSFYWPSFGRSLFMVSAVFALLSVLATIGWLVFKGVDEEKWRAQAAVPSIWA